MRTAVSRAGFTLIELLVVISIVGLLIGILLPTLGAAQKEGKAVVCAANSRTVAQAVQGHVNSAGGQYPPSYVYGAEQTGGTWRPEDQLLNNPAPVNGYVHWSFALFDSGDANPEAFRCPSVDGGGAPRTNPGPDPDDWEPGQMNDLGQSAGSQARFPQDRQAPRMAYTGNAALFPRNKFTQSGGGRRNVLVRDASLQQPHRTILSTEFLFRERWRSLSDNNGVVKSHRPVTPFVGGSSGTDVYSEPTFGSLPRFFYPSEESIYPVKQIPDSVIEDAQSTLNAVGRHHPGGDKEFGGTANFSFADGHVERMTILQSIRERKWGDRFYSISGLNLVDMERSAP